MVVGVTARCRDLERGERRSHGSPTPVRTGQFEERYPELAPLLATPCDFVIYHKSLRTLPAREDWDNGHC